jgi:hypothetical protein
VETRCRLRHRWEVKVRKALVLALFCLVALVGSSGTAGADTTIGEPGNGYHCYSIDASYSAVQVSSTGPNYTVPGPGTLTSWTIEGGPIGANPGTFHFAVWRPLGPSFQYTLVFKGPAEVVLADGVLHTFALAPAAAVQAGDVIGLIETAGDGQCLRFEGTADVVGLFFTNAGQDPVVGDDVTFQNGNTYISQPSIQVNVAANFVPEPEPVPPTPPTPEPPADGVAPEPGAAAAVVATPQFTG